MRAAKIGVSLPCRTGTARDQNSAPPGAKNPAQFSALCSAELSPRAVPTRSIVMPPPHPSRTGNLVMPHRSYRDLAVAVSVMALLIAPQTSNAQPSARAASPALSALGLTLEDLLDVRATTAGDLSADGHWLFATMSRPRTSMGVDYNRSFGDPTYVAPTKRESFIIDTRTGERVALFAEPRVIGASSWSPDGATLALLAQNTDDRFDITGSGAGASARIPPPCRSAHPAPASRRCSHRHRCHRCPVG